jgi:hypothetical protein
MSCSQAKNEVVAPQSEEMSDYSGFNFKIDTPVEVSDGINAKRFKGNAFKRPN